MRSEDDPDHALERLGDEFEERKQRLDDQLDAARERLAARAAEARHLGEGEGLARTVPAHPDADDATGGDDPKGAA